MKKLKLENLKSKISLPLRLCGLILLFATFTLAQGTAGDLKSQAALVSEFEVNGLKVLVKRRPNAPSVAAGLFLRGGTRNLTAENAGIESFMLTAATEASKKYPRDVLRRELASTGALIGAGASYDFSAISLVTTKTDFDRSWDVFTDIINNPLFAPEDVERLKNQAVAGLREQTTDADAYLNVLQEKAVFAGHPYANDPNGTLETVSSFKPEDLRRYHQNAMQTSRLLLVIVGDFDAETLKPKITAAFGKLPRGNYQEKPLPALKFDAPDVEITTRELPTNFVQGTYAAPAPSDPDVYAMRVATTILQERVFQEIRVERNLSYAPSASIDKRAANTGGIYVSAVDANQSVSIMLDEIKRLQTELVNQRVIDGITGQYLTVYYLGQETNSAQVSDLALHELIGGGWRKAFETLDKTRQVTPADIRRVAQKYMRNIKFVVLGNPNYVSREIFTKQ